MYRKCKVVMLPTNKAEACFLLRDKRNNPLDYLDGYFTKSYLESENIKAMHLYIISDEEIKKGDLVYNPVYKTVYQWVVNADIKFDKIDAEKIIASTDSSLNLPQPSQSFIEKYIEEYNKRHQITDVLVEYEQFNPSIQNIISDDGLFIPKINPKDNTITTKNVKDSWNREEVIELLHQYDLDGCSNSDIDFYNWINKNL